MALNTATIGGLPVYDPPDDAPLDVNFFEMAVGATKWGTGQFLMNRADYSAALADSTAGVTTLVMSSGSSAQTVTMYVVLGGWEPYRCAIGSSDNLPSDLVRVTVFDERCKQTGTVTNAYNVQLNGLHCDKTTTDHVGVYETTTSSGTPHTWSSMFTSMATGVDVSGVTLPSWVPMNVAFNNVQKSVVIDWAASELSLIVGYAYSTNALKFFTPGTWSATNTALYAASRGACRIEGSAGERCIARRPGKAKVSFTSVRGAGDVSSSYSPDDVVLSGGGDSDLIVPINHTMHLAMFADGGTAPVNATALGAVATDLAARYTALITPPPGWEHWAGIHPFVLDGCIRRVRWSTLPPPYGATTTIYFNDPVQTARVNFSPMGGTDQTLLTGIGALSFANSFGSAHMVGRAGTFYAKVTHDSLRAIGASKVTAIPCTSGGTLLDQNCTIDLFTQTAGASSDRNTNGVLYADDDVVVYLPVSITTGVITGAANENPLLFPVALVNPSTTDPTTDVITYCLESINGTELDDGAEGSRQAPTCPREIPGIEYNHAHYGLAYYTNTGAVKLYHAFETAVTDECYEEEA